MDNRTLRSQSKISRRDFIKICAVAGGVVAGSSLLHFSLKAKNVTVRDTRLLMGTVIDITLVAETSQLGQAAINAAFSEMERLTHIFDYRKSDSELARLNLNGKLEHASADLVAILQKACNYSDISGGAFDVTVLPVLETYQAGHPVTSDELALIGYQSIDLQGDRVAFKKPGMRATLDGIAKGRVVDYGVRTLKEQGFDNILVEAGGDLLADGTHPNGSLWDIGVANPRPTANSQWLATLRVNDQAVATSGDYMQAFTSDYSLNHIIDPRTGVSPAELSSATVIAPTVTDADALATTLMVLGSSAGLALVERLPGIEAMLATKDLTIYRSSGFPSV